MLADRSPAGLAHRLTVANRAGPFGPNGFPNSLRPPGTGPWHRVLHHPHALLTGTATAVIAAGVIAVGIIAGLHHSPSSGAAGGSSHGASVSTASPPQARGGPSGRGGNGTAPSVSTPGGTTSPVAFRSPGAPGSASATTNSSPAAGSSSTPSSSTQSSTPSSASAGAGTLSVSTGQVDLVSVNGTATGKFTLTAHGGPVSSYTVTVGSALVGHISVSPSSGSLAAGCERNDHRHLHEPGRPGRAAHRQPRWPDDHGAGQPRTLSSDPPSGSASHATARPCLARRAA